ncbi:MAG: cyclohexanecarboxylate-CoA ligase [Pseudonocardiales bacterium]|nr:cyclohexanecarboxylate-CoA ligase [Pseudonocardiales bacterium]
MRLLVKGSVSPLGGELTIPVSKYHAHRALLLASLAPGTSRIHGLSDAGHVGYTIRALRRLGTAIETDGDTFCVRGGQYHPRGEYVSVGSSGTTLYFLTPLAALADAPVTIVGQKYFQRRPIRPLLDALTALGVRLDSATGTPPISVAPHRPTGGRVSIPGTLSQWISGLLLLAPFATGSSLIEVTGAFNERSYVDLTIAMMGQFGLAVEVGPDGRSFAIEGNQQPHAATVQLPPDIGCAAFGLAATALHPSDVLFRGLRSLTAAAADHPEADLLDILTRMGVPIRSDPETGFVRVSHDGLRLSPVSVDCRTVPDMLPVLSVLASLADGTSELDNVAHVRLKESDRVAAMLQLNRMGAQLELRDDRLVCTGVAALTPADLSAYNDHRVLMALAIAASRADGESRLTYPNAYKISYPRFLDEMNSIGMTMASVRASAGRPSARRPVGLPAAFDPDALAGVAIDAQVRRWASECPTETAVVELASPSRPERVLTWQELDAQADALATVLLDLGVAPGEPVAWQLPNWTEFVVLALATARIGAVSCPLMPIFRQRELSFMLSRSAARVLVVPEEFRGRDHLAETTELLAGPAAPPVEHVLVVGGGRPLPAGRVRWHRYAELAGAAAVDPAGLDGRRPAPGALAQLLFTSGTSGEPKGVLHRMESLTRAVGMEIEHLGLSRADRVFIPSPLAHQTGYLYGMWLAWSLGVAQVLQPIWHGRAALTAMHRWQPSFVQAATPFLADLVTAVAETGQRPERLRIFVATGTAVPRALAERATRLLDAAVCGAWGTTETCLGTLAAPGDEPALVWGTDGRALAGVGVRVVDDEGNVLGPGQEGNFEITSGCLFAGYLDRPDLTAEALTPDGWYRSGDLAVISESGYVRFTGRVKDVINRGGEKVPVAEIEQLLHEHPAIREVAIVAMPDPRLGERACAFVVAEVVAEAAGAPLDLAALQQFLDARQVSIHYWPERLELVAELPRNPAGKVQKYLLRERIKREVQP